MTDIDEIFRASIDLEGDDPGPDDDAGGASRRPIDLRDDDTLDIGRLVARWNEEHDPSEPDERASSRLAGARDVIADHIGSHPTETVEPPEPPDEPDVDGVQKLSRRDRRRAQREIDQLQREVGDGPTAASDPATDDVNILPPSAEVVAAAAAAATAAPKLADPPVALPARPLSAPSPDAAAIESVSDEAVTLADRAPETEAAPETQLSVDADSDSGSVEVAGTVRFPILTRSVLVWLFIFLVAGIAFGASAVFWWAHFNSEVDAIRTETSSFAD